MIDAVRVLALSPTSNYGYANSTTEGISDPP